MSLETQCRHARVCILRRTVCGCASGEEAMEYIRGASAGSASSRASRGGAQLGNLHVTGVLDSELDFSSSSCVAVQLGESDAASKDPTHSVNVRCLHLRQRRLENNAI